MRSLLIFLVLGNYSILYAQNGYYTTGASDAGMANATAAIYSANPLFHNIASLAAIDAPQLAFSYDYRGFVAGINNISLQYMHSANTFKSGIGIFKSGDEILNEFVASAGIAQKLGIANIGVKVNYHQLYSEAFGYTYAATVSSGVLADLSKEFTVGAYLNNARVINIKDEFQELNIPVSISMGVSYKATANLLLALSALKDINRKLQISSGIEYKLLDALYLRSGINWHYKDLYYGIGYLVKRIKVDYALNPVSHLGQVHSLTIFCKLSKADERE